MKILILSGISGSGKTTFLKALEDVGYFCVDNFPLVLLRKFLDLAAGARIEAREIGLRRRYTGKGVLRGREGRAEEDQGEVRGRADIPRKLRRDALQAVQGNEEEPPLLRRVEHKGGPGQGTGAGELDKGDIGQGDRYLPLHDERPAQLRHKHLRRRARRG